MLHFFYFVVEAHVRLNRDMYGQIMILQVTITAYCTLYIPTKHRVPGTGIYVTQGRRVTRVRK